MPGWIQAIKDTSALVRTVVAVGVIVIPFGVAWARIPAQVRDNSHRLDKLEASQDRTTRGVQYLVCRDQRRERSQGLDYCEAYWSPQDFLPPGREP